MTSDTTTLLEQFFSPPNTIGRDDPEAASWAQLVLDGAGAFLLPRRDESGAWTWYAVGMSDATARALQEEVEAFVGPTYARIEAEAAVLDSADPLEAALESLPTSRIFRIHAAEPKAAAAIGRQLALMQSTWYSRPPITGPTQRTTSQILRALDSAMSSGHLRQARELIDELHAGGRLSNVNLECLEIWWLAAQERWADLLVRSGLDDLIALRLPRNATAALIEAVYHVHVEPHEAAAPNELADLFAERVLPRFGRLFRNPAWSTTTSGRKAWMLFAASTTPPSETIREAVLLSATEAERRLLAQLTAETAGVAVPEADPVRVVMTMLETGDFGGAWEAVAAADSAEIGWRARVMLHCAYETAEPKWAAAALAGLDEARLADPARVAGRTIDEQEHELRRLVTPADVPIADWYDWLASLAASTAPRDLVALARDRSEEWTATTLLEQSSTGDLALDVVTASTAVAEAFREVRPLLLPAVFAASTPRADLTPSASALLRVVADGLVSDDRLGYADLDDLTVIADFALTAGLTADEYRQFLFDTLQAAWERSASVKTLGWLADTVELVAASPCPDEGARLAFAELMLTALARFRSQVPSEHWDRAEELFEHLGRRAEVVDLRPAAEEREAVLREWDHLAGKRVFVYTLVEQAGERARRFLADVSPTAVVDVWAAEVADDRMLQAVRSASLVVIATRAAKHAATLAIEREIPDGVPVAYPAGKGWSSIVMAVRDALPQLGQPSERR